MSFERSAGSPERDWLCRPERAQQQQQHTPQHAAHHRARGASAGGNAASSSSGGGGGSSGSSGSSSSTSTTTTTQRFMTGDQANRITVDIRGASLESDWNVYVKRQDEGRFSRVDHGLRSVSATVQSVAGAFISLLMMAKLVEEIVFIRKLRRELGSITAAFSDGSGLEMNQEASAGSKASGGGGARSGGALDLVAIGLAASGAAKPNEPGAQPNQPHAAHGLHRHAPCTTRPMQHAPCDMCIHYAPCAMHHSPHTACVRCGVGHAP
eukprot:334115-Chlamydomonas_euryale.AAC.2